MSLNRMEQRRKVAVTRISETYTLAIKSQTDSSQHNLFKIKYDSLEEVYTSFNELHNEVIGLIDEKEFEAQDVIRKSTDEFYFKTKEIFNKLFPSKENHSLVSINSQDEKIKLPKITIPVFDGTMLKWPTFYDLFSALVHNNSSLANIHKFQYLISFVQGEPLNLIKSIQTTDANYLIAFNTLVNRYQNKRILAASYWHEIYNVPSMKTSSYKDLRNLLDVFTENLSALQVLEFPVQHWCFILFNLLLQKLDSATRTAFEVKYTEKDIPTYKDLKEFLEKQCKALESVQFVTSQSNSSSPGKFSKPSNSVKPSFSKTPVTSALLVNQNAPPKNLPLKNNSNQNQAARNNSQNCKLCNQMAHPLAQCPEFISKTPSERFSFVKQNRVCINCLRYNHLLKDCTSSFNCRVCRYRHHTMMHLPQTVETNRTNAQSDAFINSSSHSINAQSSPQPSKTNANISAQSLHNQSNLSSVQASTSQPENQVQNYCTSLANAFTQSTVLLSTTRVEILDSKGNYQIVRVVLDSGSQANFISQKCLSQLGLTKKRFSIPVQGLNGARACTNGVASCSIRPVGQTQPTFCFDVLVLPNLCTEMPSHIINTNSWSHISNLKLGDDRFHIPAPVDLLLGAEAFAHILKEGRVLGQPGQPTALETVFGWVLLGKTQEVLTPSVHLQTYFSSFDSSLDSDIRKFWELEAIAAKPQIAPEEEKCEEIYRKTVSRDPSGRFIVSLPFRHSEPDLGDTFTMAYRSFKSLETRLIKNPELYNLYSEFMRNYLENGHMTLIASDEPKPIHSCYLPHHGVIKVEKTTSKVRVVFNASAKGSKGISLNDTLLPGPKLQADLSGILVKFRVFPIIFLADIKQMYLQIQLTPEHRDYQRLIWRFNPNDPIKQYRLNTVTFGVTSSPYLAIRTLKELAKQERSKYPNAADILLNNTFMDDICAGSDSLESALALQKEIIALLKAGGFELRKWASNHFKLLSSLAAADCQVPVSFDREVSSNIKVLGLLYNPSVDKFSFSHSPSNKPPTKRNILSEIARIFDPLGFLSPVTFLAKHIMQRLWISGIGWDEIPAKPICDIWVQFKLELPRLSQISLPRFIFAEKLQRCQLLGFCDASEKGYACAVYLRIELPNDTVKSSLIIAKSRVAPLKTVSLPRLELLGAALLAELLKFIIDLLSKLISINEVLAFTDSQVVLAWLSSSPHKWKTFVANRVSQVQETIPTVPWYHISSGENPVDCASRGLTPSNLINHPLWFQGPPWILLPRAEWDLVPMDGSNLGKSVALSEQKTCTFAVTLDPNPLDCLVTKFSSILKIQHIIGYVLRFTSNTKAKSRDHWGVLTEIENQNALRILIRHVQSCSFSDVISQLRTQALIPKPFRKLAVFLDADGCLRVGGRLKHSDLSFDAKHPYLLPRNHRLTHLLIENMHRKHLHVGLNTVHYLLRQQFWILSARRAIQKVLSQCVKCFRVKPKTFTPLMGDLPSFRICQLKCFSQVALDYAGPLKITMGRHRGAKVMKAYVCIFVCCTTKAIHIELVSDLTSDAFIAAFRRFVARRGKCTNIFSDCGTNFVGARNQLEKLSQFASESLQIRWHQ
ncbi:uncharacterized protein LOC116177021 [Photinus pyralis]|uniref:uncharacterized protein LOC116177021 n=2 Tax=Photinus pyralis TaxID=7054 RepID=UPI0012677B11|nr:uncharacterized protein LOC116177021 [Photinus pyralis]